MQERLEQDNYDYFKGIGWWDIGLRSEGECGRRVRICYEHSRQAIAASRHDDEFLDFSVVVVPQRKFYLLARYLGRKELRRQLQNPPVVGSGDGFMTGASNVEDMERSPTETGTGKQATLDCPTT